MGEAKSLATAAAEALEQLIRERAAIRAYHGSPHVFDKFDVSKIGAGEGGQMYGHGLYFTETEAIAKGYRDRLAGPSRDKSLGLDDTPIWAADGSHHEWNDLNRALHSLDTDEITVYDHYVSQIEKTNPELHALVTRMLQGPENERIAHGHVGGKQADVNWKRLKELAPETDFNFLHDYAPIVQARKLHRGLLELHARTSWMPPGRESLARIREDLEATVKNIDKQHARGTTFSGSRDEDLYRRDDVTAALHALDHYGERLNILPPVKPGATYEVAIKASPEEFLHWDLPMKDQPPAVRRALGVSDEQVTRYQTLSRELANVDTRIDARRRELGDVSLDDPARYERPPDDTLERLLDERDRVERELRTFQPALERTGRRAWEATVSAHQRAGPTRDWGTFGDPAAAAAALKTKGVKGIKYLDGFSRGAGEGSHNYVVFDDATVDILKRYGIAGLMAGGAAGYGQAGAGDVTVQHAAAGGKGLARSARQLGELLLPLEERAPTTLRDVALPGLEAVRETEHALPTLEAPFALTSPIAAPSKGTQGSLLGAAAGGTLADTLRPVASHDQGEAFWKGKVLRDTAREVADAAAPEQAYMALARRLRPPAVVAAAAAGGARAEAGPPSDAVRPMPSHGIEQQIRQAAALRPMSSHAPAALNAGPGVSLGRADRIGPDPGPPAPEPYILPPGLFDTSAPPGEPSRFRDWLATPAKVGDPQRFPLDEFLELSGLGDPSQHMPAGTLGAAVGPIRRGASGALDLSEAARLERARALGFDTNKTWYHGTQRLDRIADSKGFDPKRATSGPSAYFTDDPAIAASYAQNKRDTSLEMPDSYAGWFKFKVPGTKHTVDLDQQWYRLPYEDRARVTDALSRVGRTDDGKIVLGDTADAGPGGARHWEHTLREHRGNALAAARDIWLDSATLFGDEERFLDVLERAGVSGAIYDSPHAVRPGIVAVHARVQHPLNVNDPAAIATVLPELRDAARRRRAPRVQWGTDHWDKRTRDPKGWLHELESDDGHGTAWTSIPDWVTERLRALGYDGILDRGGKYTGHTHQVLIPFEASQVRAPWARFDPRHVESRDLLAGVAGAAVAGSVAGSAPQDRMEADLDARIRAAASLRPQP